MVNVCECVAWICLLLWAAYASLFLWYRFSYCWWCCRCCYYWSLEFTCFFLSFDSKSLLELCALRFNAYKCLQAHHTFLLQRSLSMQNSIKCYWLRFFCHLLVLFSAFFIIIIIILPSFAESIIRWPSIDRCSRIYDIFFCIITIWMIEQTVMRYEVYLCFFEFSLANLFWKCQNVLPFFACIISFSWPVANVNTSKWRLTFWKGLIRTRTLGFFVLSTTWNVIHFFFLVSQITP